MLGNLRYINRVHAMNQSRGQYGLVRTRLLSGTSWVRIPLGRDNFQTISTPSLYSMRPRLSIKWTGRRLATDSSTKLSVH